MENRIKESRITRELYRKQLLEIIELRFSAILDKSPIPQREYVCASFDYKVEALADHNGVDPDILGVWRGIHGHLLANLMFDTYTIREVMLSTLGTSVLEFMAYRRIDGAELVDTCVYVDLYKDEFINPKITQE